jgi:hypothetical protein
MSSRTETSSKSVDFWEAINLETVCHIEDIGDEVMAEEQDVDTQNDGGVEDSEEEAEDSGGEAEDSGGEAEDSESAIRPERRRSARSTRTSLDYSGMDGERDTGPRGARKYTKFERKKGQPLTTQKQ